MKTLSKATRGVIPIVPTPFGADGGLDLASIARLVDYYEACGVVGLTILGVMGEAAKLSHAETETVTREFLARAAGRLPVLIGVSGASLAASVELSLWAMEQGAAGVMLQPMPGLQGDDAVFGFFKAFAEQTGGRCPICVQDYPVANGVTITVGAWRRIAGLEPVFMLKHEPPAGLPKLTQIRASETAGQCPRVSILTSNNALHLPQELERGADGAMVGVAYSDVVVRICALYEKGEVEPAFDIYDALLPVIRHESQGAFGLAIRKETLRRRGVLATSTVRYPGYTLTATDNDELTRLIGRFTRRLAALGVTLAA